MGNLHIHSVPFRAAQAEKVVRRQPGAFCAVVDALQGHVWGVIAVVLGRMAKSKNYYSEFRGIRVVVEGVYPPIMENQMEKDMESYMETVVYGLGLLLRALLQVTII